MKTVLEKRDSATLDGNRSTFEHNIAEMDEVAKLGLRRYVSEIAYGLGLDSDVVWWKCDSTAEAFIPLDVRLATYPELDVALSWDCADGWSVTLDRAGSVVAVVDRLTADVLASVADVVDFVARVQEGRSPNSGPPQRSRAEVFQALADMRSAEPTSRR